MSRRALSDNLDRPNRAVATGAIGVDHMRRAIALAAAQQPHPNPRVGAVIVDVNGSVIAQAAHRRAGEPHAEALALAEAGERARNATVYVTLEPCSHEGRTPPCSRALIDAGVGTVVIGAVDPDQRVSGSGIAELRRAGIHVTTGVLEDEIEQSDPGYFHHRRTGKPLITLKLASTLDGQIAAADHTSRWITGDEARRDAHRLRAESDVVIVGAGTVIEDDPQLDVRLSQYEGRQPRPVVVAGKRPIPSMARVMGHDPLVYTPEPGHDRVDVAAMVSDLGARGYVSALVEGGAAVAASMIRGGHADRLVIYLAGKLGLGTGVPLFSGVFANIDDALDVAIESVTRVGSDLRIDAKVGN